MDEAEKPARLTLRQRQMIFWALMGVIFIGIYWSSMPKGQSDADDPTLQRHGAQSACEDWVRDQLKAPSTADFTGVTTVGSGPWVVTGSVDAQNSFGAKIRNTWTCNVRLDDEMFRGKATIHKQ